MTQRDEWRWTDEQGVQRLVRTEELRAAIASQVLPPSVLVWREGMSGWLPASSVAEFADAAAAGDSGPTTAPGIAEPRFGGAKTEGAALPDKRPPMSTLLGMNGPTSADARRLAGQQGAPIIVPPAEGADVSQQGRTPITLRPDFGAMSVNEAAQVIPRAPRSPVEGEPATQPSAAQTSPQVSPTPPKVVPAPPPRAPTTSAIDGLWAGADDETTNVTDIAAIKVKTDAPQAKPAPAPSPKPAAVAPRADGPVRPAVVAVPRSTPPPPLTTGSNASAAFKPIPALAPKAPSLPKAETTSVTTTAARLGLSTSEASPPAASKLEASAATTTAARLAPKPAPKPATSTLTSNFPALGGSGPAKPSPEKAPAPARPAPIPKPAPRTEPQPPAKVPPPVVEAAPQAPAPAQVVSPNLPPTQPPPPQPPPAAVEAPAQAPSLAEALPPPPPARETTTTAILPPDLTPGSEVEAAPAQASPPPKPSMAGAMKQAHEVSRTIKIDGVEAFIAEKRAAAEREAKGEIDNALSTTSPLGDFGVQAQKAVLPSEVGAADYPPLSALRPEGFPRQGAQGAQGGPDQQLTESSAKRARLAATVQGQRVAQPAPPQPQSPSIVPINALLASGGMLILMVIGAFFVGRCSVKPKGSTGGQARAGITNAARARRDAVPEPPKPCWVAKQPVRWAPVVAAKIPFELVPLASGNVAIGYAKASDEAIGIEVTPQSGQVSEVFSEKATGDIERVAPTGIEKGYFVTTAQTAGSLRSAVQVPGQTPFFVGISEGGLATADKIDAAASALWPISGSDPLDAARVIQIGDRGYALTYRRENAVFGGFLGPDRKPVGELVKVAGAGGQVGKPMSGYNGREIAISFAEKADESSPYKMRLGHAAAPGIPATTEVMELPAGGPGGDVFAPAITGLSDGRWLLIWTEGSAGSRAIRVLTLGPDFSAVGDPIALSPPAGNFGQGILAVSGGYVTAVFLQRGKSSYELWGGVLQCG